MAKHKIAYSELESAYQACTVGPHEPKRIMTTLEIYNQIESLLSSMGHLSVHPDSGLWFNGASLQHNIHVPDGHVWFIGGVHVLKLEVADGD